MPANRYGFHLADSPRAVAASPTAVKASELPASALRKVRPWKTGPGYSTATISHTPAASNSQRPHGRRPIAFQPAGSRAGVAAGAGRDPDRAISTPEVANRC